MKDRADSFAKRIEHRKPNWWSPRGFLLFFLPLPLFPALLISLGKGDFDKTLIHVAAMALFLGGALIARRGLQQEHENSEYKTVKRPLPLKILAAVMVSLATGLCSWLAVGHSLLFSLMVTLLTFLAFYLSYGIEPLRSLFVSMRSNIEQDVFSNTLLDAEEKIAKIENVIHMVRHVELNARLLSITKLAREIVSRIEQDPKDLHRARKFLYVYLDGALRVTEGYAKTHKQANSMVLEDKFRNVLVTIEDVFKQQQQRLLENDILDLDVQIEVLNKQMRQEGIT